MLAQAGYTYAAAITKSDTVPPVPANTFAVQAIYVGGAGDVVVTPPNSATAVTFKAPPVGTIIPIQAKFVNAATTATLLIGLGR